MFKYLVLASLMLTAIDIRCADQQIKIYQDLGMYFQELMYQDNDMVEIVKASFGVSDPVIIDFLIEQIDPINLAIDLFKQNFTLQEVQTILTFYTSETGRKFGNLFTGIMAEYSELLNQRIENCKLAIATIIVESSKL